MKTMGKSFNFCEIFVSETVKQLCHEKKYYPSYMLSTI